MITKKSPKDWKDLQIRVSEILNQSNFSTQIEYTINSLRGNYEIDVYAEEIIDDRNYRIICECKCWKSNIPQNVILAFRSILNDTGIEKGYIITTSNFQKGSHESSDSTNIKLFSWEDFQIEFFKSWYINFFYKELVKIIDTKYSSIDFQFYEDFDVIDRDEFKNLRDKYLELSRILDHFPFPYLAQIRPEELNDIKTKLPLIKNLEMEPYEIDNLLTPIDILNETHYLDLLERLKTYATPIIERIHKLNLEIIDYD